jgi:hypothetical protein
MYCPRRIQQRANMVMNAGNEKKSRKRKRAKESEQKACNKKKGEFLVMEYFPFLEKAKRKERD